MFSTATRSPTSTLQRRAAASPIASITPSGSCPGITEFGVRSCAFELLVVAAADAAGLDAKQRAVAPDLGDRQLARLELARLHEHHRERLPLGHALSSGAHSKRAVQARAALSSLVALSA